MFHEHLREKVATNKESHRVFLTMSGFRRFKVLCSFCKIFLEKNYFHINELYVTYIVRWVFTVELPDKDDGFFVQAESIPRFMI